MKIQSKQKNRVLSGMINAAMTGAVIATTTLGLVACGDMKTNPIEDYKELEDPVAPRTEKPRPDVFIDNVFSVTTKNNAYPVFAQGRKDTYTIYSRLLMDGVQYQLVPKTLPEGASFKILSQVGNTQEYALTWAPQPGTLSDQETDRPFKMTFELKVNHNGKDLVDGLRRQGMSSEKAIRVAEVLNLIGHERELDMHLLRAAEQPVVEKPQGLSETISQGQVVSFTVVVKDIGAFESRMPRLFVDEDRSASNETAKFQAADSVRISSQPVKVEEGRFKFTGQIDLSNVTLPGSSDLVPARFALVVVSPSGVPAVDRIVEFKIKRSTPVATQTKASQQPKKSTQAGQKGEKK